MQPIRVGVDAACWQNTRGYGRYARALLTAMIPGNDAMHFTLVSDSRKLDCVPAGAEIKYVASGQAAANAASAEGHRSLGDMLRMSRALSDPAFEVLLYPSVYTYVPTLSAARKIVVIHDVIAETYPELTVPRLSSRLFWKAKVAAGIRQAAVLVTVSEYSKRGIVDQFGVSQEQVFVVTEASDPVFRKLENPKLSPALRAKSVPELGRLVAYVGGFGPHKNVPTLIDAFAAIARERGFEDIVLVLVGEYKKEVFHSEAGKLFAQVMRLGLLDRVIFTGYLSDSDVVVLLNRASVLVLPSLMEGFGLPAIEAAACGCPVIATLESPLPEILAEAAIFIDPLKPETVTCALRQVLESESLRERMSEAGVKAAARCSWDIAARQMSQIVRSVVVQ